MKVKEKFEVRGDSIPPVRLVMAYSLHQGHPSKPPTGEKYLVIFIYGIYFILNTEHIQTITQKITFKENQFIKLF